MIIDQIRKRTRSGKGVTSSGKEYDLNSKPYTPQYASSKGSHNVDLTLTGDLLENLDVVTTSRDTVTIKVNDSDYGKLRGAEEGIWTVKRDSRGKIIRKDGHTIPDKLVKRPFFHLSSKDIKAIKSDPKFKETFNRAIERNLKKK